MGRFRALFFGTPAFSVPSLEALLDIADVVTVVTQPDRPSGRGLAIAPTPVKARALAAGVPVLQPTKLKPPEFAESLRALEADVGLVIAYGRILPKAVLEAPRLGCVNVHASLLPRHRGAAPVQAALLAGDAETGVSIMQMDAGLDTGPVLLQARTRLHGGETAGELLPRLAHLGAGALLEAVAGLESGALAATPQPAEGATLAPRLTREQGRADWAQPAASLGRQLRAFTPWPGVNAELAGAPIKLLAARPLDERSGEPAGSVLGLRDGALAVACGEGTVIGLERLQRPGRRPLAAPELLRGERLDAGARFS